MPSQIISTSVAAGATGNPLSGTQYEFVEQDSALDVGVLAEATGVLVTSYAGSDLIMEEGPSPIGSANQIPVIPDNLIISELVAGGTRMKLAYRNTSGATVVVKTLVKIRAL